LQVGDDREHVIVEIATDGGEFRVVPEVIHEELHGGQVARRLAVALAKPVTQATITLTITP
jgi:hypothetical protein